MKLSERLVKKAAYIRGLSPALVAIDLLKEAGLSEEQAAIEIAQLEMEKTAATKMAEAGLDYDEALKMVKVSGIKIDQLEGFSIQKSTEQIAWEELTKLASSAQDMEAELQALHEKVAELEAALAQVPETVQETPAAIQKLASCEAFTNADLEALMRLPSDTLTKVASVGEAPWKMGSAAGLAVEALDPIAQFALGS